MWTIGRKSGKHDLPRSSSTSPGRQYPLIISRDILKTIPSKFSIGSKTTSTLVSASAVVAHLRLLAAFRLLEHRISVHQQASDVVNPSNPPDAVRWRVFVHQAVWRFELWLHHVMKPRGTSGSLKEEEIPPLDVLLIWHAYLLNPRVYADDTQRIYPELAALNGLPLEMIAIQINPTTLKFEPTTAQVELWERVTRTSHEPLSLSPSNRDTLPIECPNCDGPPSQVPWLCQATLGENGHAQGMGWCQNAFSAHCGGCGFKITRDSIAVGRFAADIVGALTNRSSVLGGLLYDPQACTLDDGVAQQITALLLQPFVNLAPTRQAIGEHLAWSFSGIESSMKQARDMLVDALRAKNPHIKEKEPSKIGLPTRHGTEQLTNRILEAQTLSVPRDSPWKVYSTWLSYGPRIAAMLSSYKDNPTPFSTDLVGAVIRQTSFTSKAFRLGWLDPLNPKLPISQSIKRYHNFLHLMSKSSNFLVPTLDIDLSWHTHQLSGNGYMTDMKQWVGRYVDHDDRVEEGVLSDGFDITSQEWRRIFNTPYSSCESNLHTVSRATMLSKIKKVAKQMVIAPNLTTYPSEHPNTIVLHDKKVAADRRRREQDRTHAKDKSLKSNETPFLRNVNDIGNVVKGTTTGIVTFGSLGLAGWALLGEVDQCILDAKAIEKGQCCAGYGIPYFGGPLWVGDGSAQSGGCTAGGCSAGPCNATRCWSVPPQNSPRNGGGNRGGGAKRRQGHSGYGTGYGSGYGAVIGGGSACGGGGSGGGACGGGGSGVGGCGGGGAGSGGFGGGGCGGGGSGGGGGGCGGGGSAGGGFGGGGFGGGGY